MLYQLSYGHQTCLKGKSSYRTTIGLSSLCAQKKPRTLRGAPGGVIG